MTATMVAFALVGGLVFTLREFKRLSTDATEHTAHANVFPTAPERKPWSSSFLSE
jgi:hypothetical protein